MPADESAALGEMLDVSIEQEGRVRQFPAALGGIHEQGADAAVDIDHAVGPGRPGLERQRVELILSFREISCELLQQIRALMKRHSAQVLASDVPGVSQHLAHIEAATVRLRNDIAADRAANFGDFGAG